MGKKLDNLFDFSHSVFETFKPLAGIELEKVTGKRSCICETEPFDQKENTLADGKLEIHLLSNL